MSKTNKINVKRTTGVRNNVAWGMIVAGTGKAQIMRDRRQRRPKDARHHFRNEEQFDET